MIFHRHYMIEVARTYSSPRAVNSFTIDYYIRGFEREKILHGVTTILYRCNKNGCNKTKMIEMLGKEVAEDELEKMYRKS